MGKLEKKKKNKSTEIVFDIVTREEWGARPPTQDIQPLKIPVDNVRWSYTNTKQENCTSYETCCKELRALQNKFQERKIADLPYNFLVGADGRVYEGRGWYLDIDRHISLKKFRRKCIDITYIGEFANSLPPPIMTDVAAKLVEFGIELKLIKTMPRVESLNDFRDFLYYEDQEA